KAAAEKKVAKEPKQFARERRSRCDWSTIIDDDHVVRRQIAFERCATAKALRRTGKSYAEIGRHFDVNRSRAREMVLWARRTRKSPVEAYFETRNGLAVAVGHIHWKSNARAMISILDSFIPPYRDWLRVTS